METEILNVDTLATGINQGLNIQKIQDDFPMCKIKVNGKALVYFDSAETNHKPQVVIDRLAELYDKKYAKTDENHTFSQFMTEAFEDTRKKTAAFIRADSPDEIVFTSGSTQHQYHS